MALESSTEAVQMLTSVGEALDLARLAAEEAVEVGADCEAKEQARRVSG